MNYVERDRVKVIDPADRRKRVTGTVREVCEGRGALGYRILLDDDPRVMRFSEDEIVGKVAR